MAKSHRRTNQDATLEHARGAWAAHNAPYVQLPPTAKPTPVGFFCACWPPEPQALAYPSPGAWCDAHSAPVAPRQEARKRLLAAAVLQQQKTDALNNG